MRLVLDPLHKKSPGAVSDSNYFGSSSKPRQVTNGHCTKVTFYVLDFLVALFSCTTSAFVLENMMQPAVAAGHILRRFCPQLKLGFLSICLGFALSLTLLSLADSQTTAGTYADANNPAGPPGPMQEAQIWKLDPITGAVTIKIPISTTPAPGLGPTVPYILEYNSSSTVILSSVAIPPLGSYDPSEGHILYSWAGPNYNAQGANGASAGPWTTSGPMLNWSEFTFTPGQDSQQNAQQCSIFGPYIYTDENGGAHDTNFAITQPPGLAYAPCSNYPTTSSSMASDGSALSMTDSSHVVYPNGTIFNGPIYNGTTTVSSTLTDANGNEVAISTGTSSQTVTDSMGRTDFVSTFLPLSSNYSQSPTATSTITTYSSTGTPNTWTVQREVVPIGQITMPQPTSSDIASESANYPAMVDGLTGGSAIVISSIQLPNGTSYQFQYDPLYGTISKIIFPTGGYVRFVWAVRSAGTYNVVTWGGGMSTIVATDAYLSTGTGAESHWHYCYQPLDMSSFPSVQLHSSETDPEGTITAFTAAPFNYSQEFSGGTPTFQETLRTITNSSGQLIRTIATSFSNPTSAYGQGLPYQVLTTYNDISPALNQMVQYQYDQYDNVIEKDESGFYTGSTPSWLRKTLTTYYWSVYPAYQSAHIVNKPYTVMVTDGSGNPASETQYDYDQSTPTPHGNLISEKQCLQFSVTGCSSWLPPTTYSYDSHGEPTLRTDPKGNMTTYTWNNGYVTQIAYPVTNGVSHIEQYSYNPYTGEKTSFVDENGNTTGYSYVDPTSGTPDPLNRIREITLPPTSSWRCIYHGAAIDELVRTSQVADILL